MDSKGSPRPKEARWKALALRTKELAQRGGHGLAAFSQRGWVRITAGALLAVAIGVATVVYPIYHERVQAQSERLSRIVRVRQLQQLGSHAEAQPILDQLLQDPGVAEDPALRARVNLLQGVNLLGDRDVSQLLTSRTGLTFASPSENDAIRACTYLRDADRDFKTLKDARGQADALGELASAYVTLSNYRNDTKNLETALSFAVASAKVSLESGETTDSLITQLVHADLSCDLASRSSNWDLLAPVSAALESARSTHFGKANLIYYSIQQHAEFSYSLARWEQTGQRRWLDSASKAASLAADALYPEGDSDIQAAALYDKAAALSELGDATNRAAYVMQAASAMQDALALTDQKASPVSAALCRCMIGDFYITAVAMGPPNRRSIPTLRTALKHFQQAESVFTRSSNPMRYAMVMESEATIHLLLAGQEATRDHLNQAHALISIAAPLLVKDGDANDADRVRMMQGQIAYYRTFSDADVRRMSRGLPPKARP